MNQPKKNRSINGTLPLPMPWGSRFEVTGGRSHGRPEDMFFVKMAGEIAVPCDVDIPTRDFDTPPLRLLNMGLAAAVTAILRERPVYVGCMGGIGRTGLFLAILAKAWGVEDPVAYVREHYLGHAVETKQQQQFVAEYEVPVGVTAAIKTARLWHWVQPWKAGRNLTVSQETF